MKNPIGTKAILVALTCAVSIGLVIAVLNTDASTWKKGSYFEAGDRNVVGVPGTAQYVEPSGRAGKIVRLASLTEVQEGCRCPKCCDGYCYVTIYTVCVPGSVPFLPMAILVVSCA